MRAGKRYALVAPFDWQLRGNGKGHDQAEARERYVRKHGYVTTTRSMDSTEKEIQIALDRLPANVIPMTILYRPEDGPYYAWPEIPSDDCGSPMLLAGVNASNPTFEPSAWGQLVIKRASVYQVPAELLLQ